MASDFSDRPHTGLARPFASPRVETSPMDRTERMAAVFGGGLLVHWGLRHGGLLGLLGAAAGGTLAYMGVEGRGVRFDDAADRPGYGPARRDRFGLDDLPDRRPAGSSFRQDTTAGAPRTPPISPVDAGPRGPVAAPRPAADSSKPEAFKSEASKSEAVSDLAKNQGRSNDPRRTSPQQDR